MWKLIAIVTVSANSWGHSRLTRYRLYRSLQAELYFFFPRGETPSQSCILGGQNTTASTTPGCIENHRSQRSFSYTSTATNHASAMISVSWKLVFYYQGLQKKTTSVVFYGEHRGFGQRQSLEVPDYTIRPYVIVLKSAVVRSTRYLVPRIKYYRSKKVTPKIQITTSDGVSSVNAGSLYLEGSASTWKDQLNFPRLRNPTILY